MKTYSLIKPDCKSVRLNGNIILKCIYYVVRALLVQYMKKSGPQYKPDS